MNQKKLKSAGILIFLSLLTSTALYPQDKRAMTLEDVMTFHHMQSPVISDNGRWVAFGASPDRGDGYGVLVSSDSKTQYKIERGRHPRFSRSGDWVLFTLVPSLRETEGIPGSERPKDSAVLMNTSSGSQRIYHNVKMASFSTSGQHLFIHRHHAGDTTGTKEQNEKVIKSGTDLLVKNLSDDRQKVLPFVDTWTVDSLSSILVFTRKDTLENNNGLYFLSLDDPASVTGIVDTAGTAKFGNFTWYEKNSKLAYMRAEELKADTTETAVLCTWQITLPGPDLLLTQDDVPMGYFLPFNNNLTWSNDGNRLFFGFRPSQYAAKGNENKAFKSVIDSIAALAEIDIWHGEDLLIKTHEKSLWAQTSSQNLISVLHVNDRKVVQLADTEVPDVLPSLKGDFAMAWTFRPHSKRITWEGSFRDLYAINIGNGEKELVATGLTDYVSISPEAGYMLYFENDHWHSYEILTGRKTNLTSGIDVPFYREDHDTPSPPSSYRVAGWMEKGESVLIYDRYDIWRADLRTGNMLNLTAGEGRKDRRVFRIRKMDNEPFFGNTEQIFIEGFSDKTKERALYLARPDRQGVRLVLDAGKNLRMQLLSNDKKTVVYSRESYNEFPDLWVTDTRFRDPVRISRLGEQTGAFNWGAAELMSFTSDGGIPLQGVVIKPGDYDPEKKYPVFVYFYEKFSQRLHEFNQTVINHRPSFAYYASNGYVVFLPDIHFEMERPGMSAVNSLVPAVNKLIEEGIADPDAIGLHGHSWSGYQAAYVVTQTDIFRAAIAGAPVSNMTSAYGGIRWGSGLARQFQYETGQSRIGSSIFENRDLYIENSPLFYADKIKTPVLIMHGDVDEAVPWEQSIELYLAMRRSGRDIIFLQYRDEPHHPQKYHNKVDYTIRMKEYFDYHLRGYEPAGWIIEGRPYTGD
jgi:dipeptidyl aminopeptidase/acylaminoacyl peptidase